MECASLLFVLLSAVRTQPPFTFVTLLIKGQGPSECPSATQHIYKLSVQPCFSAHYVKRKVLIERVGEEATGMYHSVNMTPVWKCTVHIVIQHIIKTTLDWRGESDRSVLKCVIFEPEYHLRQPSKYSAAAL